MKKKTSVIATSVATIAVCASLITGSTFALFTSESKTDIAITSAKVDVTATIGDIKAYHVLANGDGEYAYPETANGLYSGNEVTVKDGVLNLKNVAPGDKVTFNITVENKSTINVQYRTKIACVEGEALMSGLTFKVGETDYSGLIKYVSAWGNWTEKGSYIIPVSVELPYGAGSEYQNLSCKISYAVEAVQGNGYTTDESELIKTSAGTAEELEVALDYVSANGGIVTLTDDIEFNNYNAVLNKDTVVNLNGHTITKDVSVNGSDHLFTVAEGANVTIKNGTIIDDHSEAASKDWGYAIDNHGNLTLNDVHMESMHNTSSLIRNYSNSKDDIAVLTINGGTYIGHDMITLKCDRWSKTYINGGTIQTNKNNNILCYGKLVINDGVFTSTAGDKVALVVSSGRWTNPNTKETSEYSSDVTINGGTFNGLVRVLNGYGCDETIPGNTKVVINGGTFNGVLETTFGNYSICEEDTLEIADGVNMFNKVGNTDLYADSEGNYKVKLLSGEIVSVTAVEEQAGLYQDPVAGTYYLTANATSKENVLSMQYVGNQAGATLVLASDVSVYAQTYIKAENVTFDLGGHTLTTGGTIKISASGATIKNGNVVPNNYRGYFFELTAGLQDIVFDNIVSTMGVDINDGCSVVLNDCTIHANRNSSFTNTNYSLYVKASASGKSNTNVTINGGNYYAGVNSAGESDKHFLLNGSSGAIKVYLTIKGDAKFYTSDGEETEYVAYTNSNLGGYVITDER